MTAPQTVRRFSVKTSKGILGGRTYKVAFDCPQCRAKLSTVESEIGIVDHCPDCQAEFIVPRSAAEQLGKLREEDLRQERVQEEKREKAKRDAEAARRREEEEYEKAQKQQRKQIEDEARANDARHQLEREKVLARSTGVRDYRALREMAALVRAYRITFNIVVLILYLLAVVLSAVRIYPTRGISSILFRMFGSEGVEAHVILFGVLVCTLIGWNLLLRIFEECILLMINLSQDTERILLHHEASQGKPWAR